jgi:hypothetical protein
MRAWALKTRAALRAQAHILTFHRVLLVAHRTRLLSSSVGVDVDTTKPRTFLGRARKTDTTRHHLLPYRLRVAQPIDGRHVASRVDERVARRFAEVAQQTAHALAVL